MLDSEWRRLKSNLQLQLSAKEERKREIFATHIRPAQWRRMTAHEDAWKAWRAAASHFRGELVRHAALEDGVDAVFGSLIQDTVEACDVAPASEAPLQDLCEGTVREASPSPESELLCSPTQAPLLGAPDDGVPPDVHTCMETLANAGAIETTTLEQRRRNGRTPKTVYGVPRWLQEALTYSYISPKLPAPTGFVWKNVDRRWQLVVKGD